MDPKEVVDSLFAEFLPTGWIREQELCARMGIGQDILRVCLRWDVIPPPKMSEEGSPFYPAEVEERLRRGLRLHRDLGINWVGVGIILDLVERLDVMEHHIHERFEDQENLDK